MKKTYSTLSTFTCSIAGSLLLCALSHHAAAQNNELSVKLSPERATIVGGKAVMVSTERAAPGETLQYVATYENLTHTLGRVAMPIAGITTTLPIPDEMVFTGTSKPTPVSASLDGKTFAPYPIQKPVKQADGSTKLMPVPWAASKALRWALPDIAPKTSANAFVSVRLISAQAGTTSP